MSATHFRLDEQCSNFNVRGQPVAILNPDSTLHDRIAFCWESANAIDSFADMCQFNDNDDIQRVGAILHHQITPLLQLLSFLGASTSQNRIGDAS